MGSYRPRFPLAGWITAEENAPFYSVPKRTMTTTVYGPGLKKIRIPSEGNPLYLLLLNNNDNDTLVAQIGLQAAVKGRARSTRQAGDVGGGGRVVAAYSRVL